MISRIAYLLNLAVLLLSIVGCAKDDAPPMSVDSIALEEELGATGLADYAIKRYQGDLEKILQTNLLRVITSKNSFDYFIHSGKHGGYQYEMVVAFVDELNAKYRQGKGLPDIQFVLLPVRSEHMIPMLLDGKGDIIAARLTVTGQREKKVRFSVPYRSVEEQIVVHNEFKEINSWTDLSGMDIAVRESSSYYESLGVMNRRLKEKGLAPIKIHSADESLETENLLALVAARRFSASVADSIVASTAASLHSELKIITQVPLRKQRKLAWAVHPKSVSLQKSLDEFLPRYRHGTLLGNMAIKKYFESSRQVTWQIHEETSAQLSVHDPLFQKYAVQYDFDWRLMAAVAYQESEFKQGAHNRSGATGVFQIKPTTAAEPYINIRNVKGASNAENNIHAGIKYLAWIKERYFDTIDGMSEADRIRMSLAAYNAGPRTLLRARAQAEAMDLNPNLWFHNVELVLLEMHKVEPVMYVSEINQHYLSYLLLGID